MEHSFLAAFAAIAITIGATFGLFALEKEFSPKETVLEEPVSEAEKEPEMRLGIFEGKLALFIGTSPYPNIVYDFFVRNLPKEDQNRLFEGIKISSAPELETLLEDFMS
ncbi:MAG: BofC C-terminal domain-containing protein [Oscillospiraceae bacterium]|nr:BofC C-terminal domain-containing protein [Oscillospiraceae bacterium]